jgi:hypothetical protein
MINVYTMSPNTRLPCVRSIQHGGTDRGEDKTQITLMEKHTEKKTISKLYQDGDAKNY